VAAGDELLGEVVEGFGGGAFAIAPQVVNRFVKAAAEQFRPDAIDQRLGEPGVVRSGDSIGELGAASTVDQAGLLFGIVQEEPRLSERSLGLGIVRVGHEVFRLGAVAAAAPHLVQRCDFEIGEHLHRQRTQHHAGEIRRQLVKLLALPGIVGMIVALGALKLDAQEDAGGLGGGFFRLAFVGHGQDRAAVGACLAGGGDNGAGDLVPAAPGVELFGEIDHRAIAGEFRRAVVAATGEDDIPPVAGPVLAVEGIGQQSLDRAGPFFRVGIEDKSRNFLRRRRFTDDVQRNAAQIGGVIDW